MHQVLRKGRGVSAVRGVALAVPITLVLALLLSQADPTLGTARDLVIKAIQDLSAVPRGICFCVLAICTLGAFGSASAPRRRIPEQPAQVQPAHHVFGDTERLIVTGSIASLIAVFLALQVSYLFGDPGGRTGTGVSFADAVHRGFVELNISSSVCAVVLFTLRRYALPAERARAIQALEWILAVQAQVLLVSAFYRVNLYEAAYGFTRLRLYVQVYAAIAFVALCFLLLELRALPVFDRLLRRVLTVAALAFGALILINSDSWIAHQNLQRYSSTGRLDAQYLTNDLGPDAVPVLVGALPKLPAVMAAHIASCLRAKYPGYPDHYEFEWYEWSLRRAALSQAMVTLGTGTAERPEELCATPY